MALWLDPPPDRAVVHIYDNDCDWVCAASPEDALAVWLEFTGEKPSDGYRVEDWLLVPDDKPLGFWCDADGKIAEPCAPENSVVKKPAREWVEKCGRGYLGSTEY